MREFKVKDSRFEINGRPIFLRGTLECAIFPRTGYPSTSTKEWTRIFSTIKAHGLNHVRFHSWCPPEAAFIAADKVGAIKILVKTGFGEGSLDEFRYIWEDVNPDYIAKNILDAVQWLLKNKL